MLKHKPVRSCGGNEEILDMETREVVQARPICNDSKVEGLKNFKLGKLLAST